MHPFDITSGTFGLGSQPTERDGAEPVCPSLPREMRADWPHGMTGLEGQAVAGAGLRLLERLLVQVQSYRVLEPPRVLDLTTLPEADRRLVSEALGEGEVSISFDTDSVLRVQETRLAGIWRLQSRSEQGRVVRDELEVAEIPSSVRELAFKGAALRLALDEEPPEGVITRSVLAEVDELVSVWRVGDLPHYINLTLLPHSPRDLAYLEQQLGSGNLTILACGYGNCRIATTGLRNCWWVRHFNSEDQLILNSIEVVDVPAAALAAQEDIEDSAARLAEILDALA